MFLIYTVKYWLLLKMDISIWFSWPKYPLDTIFIEIDKNIQVQGGRECQPYLTILNLFFHRSNKGSEHFDYFIIIDWNIPNLWKKLSRLRIPSRTKIMENMSHYISIFVNIDPQKCNFWFLANAKNDRNCVFTGKYFVIVIFAYD